MSSTLDKLLIILREIGNEMIEKEEEISIFAHYDSWKDFGNRIIKLCKELEKNSLWAKKKLKMIFLPTSDWDESGGLNGYDPNEILALLDSI